MAKQTLLTCVLKLLTLKQLEPLQANIGKVPRFRPLFLPSTPIPLIPPEFCVT